MANIQSETRYALWQLWQVIATPFRLLLVLFGRRTFADVLRPFVQSIKQFIAPKFSVTMAGILVCIFVAQLFYDFSFFLTYPRDLFSARIFSLVTAGFLHANLAHLGGNLVALLIFGRVVERKLGALKTAYLYFGALVISSVFSSVINLLIADNTPGLGASGAIMGLVGAAILLDPFYLTYQLILPIPIMVLGWLTIAADIAGVINPAEDGIGHFAHIGGFVSIVIMAYLLGVDDRTQLRKGLLINLISLVFAIGVWYVFF